MEAPPGAEPYPPEQVPAAESTEAVGQLDGSSAAASETRVVMNACLEKKAPTVIGIPVEVVRLPDAAARRF
jgi:hypothetical protein